MTPEGISWSIGIATWDGTEQARNLLQRADRAMYEAKPSASGFDGREMVIHAMPMRTNYRGLLPRPPETRT